MTGALACANSVNGQAGRKASSSSEESESVSEVEAELESEHVGTPSTSALRWLGSDLAGGTWGEAFVSAVW